MGELVFDSTVVVMQFEDEFSTVGNTWGKEPIASFDARENEYKMKEKGRQI